MTLTPDQAKARANHILAQLGPVSDWTTAVLDQAVLHLGRDNKPFGANDLRLIVPEDDCRKAGLYLHGLIELENPVILRVVGEVVSINPKAHGKKVNEYRLTRTGRTYLEDRIAKRLERRRAA
ncbi:MULTISPECIES: hypothetical protein [Streptomyces]|uniref:Uncharacterized protein n=2 Tax=Streptomyces TaxID=1883 RepID=A0A1E7LK96_9ACTN|nr:hypothetical protein [Streptomyces nanshensis]OEV16363.1 hypothetical protein AN221_32695 [Streptomyces nanshensis]